MLNRVIYVIGAVVFLMATSVHAEITVVRSEAELFSAANIVQTETFDRFTGGTGTLGEILGEDETVVNGITYTATNVIPSTAKRTVWVARPTGIMSNTIGDDVLSIEQGYTQAMGFNFLPFANAFTVVHLTATTTKGEQLIEPLTASHGATDNYRGFVSPDGIVSVAVSLGHGGSCCSNYRFDNVSRAEIVPLTIPEPSTMSVLLATLCCVFRRPEAWRG